MNPYGDPYRSCRLTRMAQLLPDRFSAIVPVMSVPLLGWNLRPAPIAQSTSL